MDSRDSIPRRKMVVESTLIAYKVKDAIHSFASYLLRPGGEANKNRANLARLGGGGSGHSRRSSPTFFQNHALVKVSYWGHGAG